MVTTAGGTTTNTIGALDDAWGLTIGTTDALTSTAVFLEVELTDTGTSFLTLQSGGTDVVFVAGKATVISPVTFRQIRVVTTAAEGTARTFRISKSIQV